MILGIMPITDYSYLTKGMLCNIPIGEKIFLVWNEYTYIKSIIVITSSFYLFKFSSLTHLSKNNTNFKYLY